MLSAVLRKTHGRANGAQFRKGRVATAVGDPKAVTAPAAAPTLQEVQEAYKANVELCSSFMLSVTKSNIPAFQSTVKDMQAYLDTLVRAKSVALQWFNDVLARLMTVPTQVLGYSDIINTLLTLSAANAEALQKNPADVNTRKLLEANLNQVKTILGLCQTFIAGTVSALKSLKNNMPQMAADLQRIADMALEDEKVDKDKIEKIKKDIDRLNAEIDNLTNSIIGLSIALGVSVILGVVATVAAFPVGAIAWLFLAPVIAVSATYIALDANQIKADQALIDNDKAQMDMLSQDVATLQIMADSYSKLSQESIALVATLDEVSKGWDTMNSEVSAAIDSVVKALADEKKPDFAAALVDIQQASLEWAATADAAKALDISDMEVTNANIQLGMTSDQVKAAIEKGTNVNIITAINA